MTNKHKAHPRTNPLPLKTLVPNSVGWTSPEEGIIYAATKRARLSGKRIVKIEVIERE